jgi:hypothetical protein
VNVYPIPASSHINIVLKELRDDAALKIFDATGRLRVAKEIINTNETLYTGDLGKGFYILSAQNGSHFYTRTLLIE